LVNVASVRKYFAYFFISGTILGFFYSHFDAFDVDGVEDGSKFGF
jgi:hypothetical protein